MTFDLILIQQATVQNPIIVVANSYVSDLRLNLQHNNEINK